MYPTFISLWDWHVECCQIALCPSAQSMEKLNLEQLPNFYIYASTHAFNIQSSFSPLWGAVECSQPFLLADMSGTFKQLKADFHCDLIQFMSTSSSGPVPPASQKRFAMCRWEWKLELTGCFIVYVEDFIKPTLLKVNLRWNKKMTSYASQEFISCDGPLLECNLTGGGEKDGEKYTN